MPRDGSACGRIVDLICRQDDTVCALALVAAAVDLLAEAGASRVISFTTWPVASAWLRAHGFRAVANGTRFTYRFSGDAGGHRWREIPWDFWHGDGDVEMYD